MKEIVWEPQKSFVKLKILLKEISKMVQATKYHHIFPSLNEVVAIIFYCITLNYILVQSRHFQPEVICFCMGGDGVLSR